MTDNDSSENTETAILAEGEVEEKVVSVPPMIDVNEFQQKSLAELHDAAQEVGLRVAGVRSKHHLVFEILRFYGSHGTMMEAEGFLDSAGDHQG